MTGQRVGYVRVSTLDQNTVRQLAGVDVDRVFEDMASGKDQNRPELEEMIRFVRDGDTVLVHSMDRLARNLDDLRSIVRRLTAKKVRVDVCLGQVGQVEPGEVGDVHDGCLVGAVRSERRGSTVDAGLSADRVEVDVF